MRAFSAVLLLLVPWTFVPVHAQTNAAPATSAAPAAGTNAAPVAVPTASVVTDAMADSEQAQTLQGQFTADTTGGTISANLPTRAAEMDHQKKEDANLLAGQPSLSQLRSAESAWGLIAAGLNDDKNTLASRLTELDGEIQKLDQLRSKWQATQAQSAGSPTPIVKRITSVLDAITPTGQAATALRSRLLVLQNSVGEQQIRLNTGLAAIRKAEQSAVSQLFHQDSAPLWEVGAAAAAGVPPETALTAQRASLHAYILEKLPTLILHLGLFLLLAVVIYIAGRELHAHPPEDAEVRQAAVIFEMPLATALVLALFAAHWLYPLPPPLFLALLGTLAIPPTVVILRRLLARDLHPVLYALVVAFFVDHVRLVLATTSWTGRLVFLAELAAGVVFLIWLLRSEKLRAPAGQSRDPLKRSVRVFAGAALLVAGAALLANVLGYVRLSYLLGNGLLRSAYLLVVLYAAVSIADGLVIGALQLPPFSFLGMVRTHRPLFRQRISRLLRIAALACWAAATLEIFSIAAPLWQGAWSVLHASVSYGKGSLSLGKFLLFGLLVWGTFLLSRFLRFLLREEIYPKLDLGPGVPYATSTLIHYVILVIGILFALPAVGIDLSQYAVLGGALGVGLGFGLQNIMNNFVSGIILLFERPVKVGDVVQIDVNVGTVERIGIRASVVRLTNGSEYIVPNGNLISNPVFNWTLSHRQRVIDLPVTVAAKTDPQRAMALLMETAKAQPLVLKDPPPRVLLTGMTGAALTLELRVWTGSSENWLQARSDLALAVAAALARENVALS